MRSTSYIEGVYYLEDIMVLPCTLDDNPDGWSQFDKVDKDL